MHLANALKSGPVKLYEDASVSKNLQHSRPAASPQTQSPTYNATQIL